MTQPEAKVDWRSLYRWQFGPAYSWILARDLAAKRLSGPARDDPSIRAAAAYLQRRDANPAVNGATESASWIAAAVIIDQELVLGNKLKTLVLANMARSEIARLIGLEARVIESWETLFFDVRDCRAALGWLAAKVIGPCEEAGDFETAARMRLALHGGPVVAEQMLTADTKFADEMKLLILKTHVGVKASRAFDIALSTPKSAAKVIQLYAEMLIEEKKLDQAAMARVAPEQRSHEFAMRQLDVEHARAQEAKARLDLETAQLNACAAAAQNAQPAFDVSHEPPRSESRSAASAQDERTEVELANEKPTQSRSAAA